MQAIQIIGPEGSGKSSILAELTKGSRALLVDPLGKGEALDQWEVPSEPVDVVIFDHTEALEAPADQLDEALSWCNRHRANLAVVVSSPDGLDELAPGLPVKVTIEVKGQPRKGSISLSSENREWFWARAGKGLPKGAKAPLKQALLQVA